MTATDWPKKIVATGCAAALAIVVLSPLPAPVGDPDTGQPPPPETEFGETVEKYENGTLQEQAENDAKELGLIPAGDTCLMRHANLARNVDRDFRRTFATVQLANGATRAREALASLKNQSLDQEPIVQWRLELETARLAIRAGDHQSAEERLRTLMHTEDIPPSCQSDTYFHLALLSHGDEAFALLEKAAQLDPVALQVQEARLAHQLRAAESSPQSCVQQVEAQIESIVYIDSLVRSDRELFRLEAMALSSPKGVMQDLMLGLLAEARNDPEAAKSAFKRAQNHPQTTCAAPAHQFTTRRLAALKEPS